MTQGAAPERPTLSIAEFYDEVQAALSAVFPRSRELWIRGELQKLTVARSGHAYLDLIDAASAGDARAPVLSINCWKPKWGPLTRQLGEEGITLEEGMALTIKGSINFYAPRGQVSLTLEEVDVEALLGRLARQRAELIESLRAEGLLNAQRELPFAEVPLRVGVVGSPGTEGYKDFLGQLERSPFGFEVIVARAAVQGSSSVAEVTAGIEGLDSLGLDVICVVRGGGSKADLAGFDAPQIAFAIARASTPVLTGIGHTGDEAVADLVAHEAHITPTACGAALVARVAEFWNGVAESAQSCAEAARSLVVSEAEAHRLVRTQLVATARRVVEAQEREMAHVRRLLVSAPSATLAREQTLLASKGARLIPSARRHLQGAQGNLVATRRLLSAFDPARTMARGWTMTTDEDGRILRSVAELERGATIVTTMVDGTIDSRVEGIRLNEAEEA